MTSIGPAVTAEYASGAAHIIENPFRCDNCHGLNIGGARVLSLPMNTGREDAMGAYWHTQEPDFWHPQFVQGQDYPDVPEHVERPASEAHMCMSVSAHMSAILMARSVIEAVAKDHGIDSGSLFKKIDAMHSKDLITEFAKKTAHTIRTFGNDMAHGDFTVEVDAADAKGVLTFMDYILREVYQAPAELQRLQDAAEARKMA
ncbi:DUF4145 domain-containing protein [Pseudarthrobacter sp. J75]|uniref:DUF4145 domain-containing protein n=1 Tax=unclassified Pseudarthrobacter TaxID=2647000 RepID=UPI002E824658|nr:MULTISPECIES: DUF4145 domain-containing protein [unclassified Pseudarthrobacter]MEE2522636.1 DUF4145 domain-containing protein [Pseudarthrobacter sp. J47]MEE2529497.1 DUF4145 domain-containing protein [Pseudarthrobacter sp. J75]